MSKKSVPPKGKSPSVSNGDAKMGKGFKGSMGSKGRATPQGCDKLVKGRGNPPGSKK